MSSGDYLPMKALDKSQCIDAPKLLSAESRENLSNTFLTKKGAFKS